MGQGELSHYEAPQKSELVATSVLLTLGEVKGKCRQGWGGVGGPVLRDWVLRQTNSVRIPALPASSCGTLGELFNLCESLPPGW